jgi:hypothetical protein
LSLINSKFIGASKSKDLLDLIDANLALIKDSNYLTDVTVYQTTTDRTLLEKEQAMSTVERTEKEGVKRKDMEAAIKQMKDDYMKKVHSIGGNLASLGVKSNKSKSISTSVGVTAKLKKASISEPEKRPREEAKVPPKTSISSLGSKP